MKGRVRMPAPSGVNVMLGPAPLQSVGKCLRISILARVAIENEIASRAITHIRMTSAPGPDYCGVCAGAHPCPL